MGQHLSGGYDPIGRAELAADEVFDDKSASFEPTVVAEAEAAVRRLGHRLEELPGSIKRVVAGGRSSGRQLVSGRLQGIAEIVQNADDVGASEVRLLLRSTDLLASHDGGRVSLADVHSMAMPWLSTKADDAMTIGRFGAGLSTLQALSTTLEVHCSPYHVRFDEQTIVPIRPARLPARFDQLGWTTFRVPLENGSLRPEELEVWLDRWDDSALLFLRHVTCVTLLDQSGAPTRRLALSRGASETPTTNPTSPVMSREVVTASDGRSWALYSTDVVAPEGLTRTRKATAPTMPIAVALSLSSADGGWVYAGLPITPAHSPLFANAQFDPTLSRTDFADTPWNWELVGLVAKVWTGAVLDHFERDPPAAWAAVPLPRARDGDGVPSVKEALEAAVINQARRQVASRLAFTVPEGVRVHLSQLAVEVPLLEKVLSHAEIAELAGLEATVPADVRDPAGRWRSVLDDWRGHSTDLPEQISVEQALHLVSDEARPAASSIALAAAALEEGLGAELLKLRCVTAHDGRRLVPPSADSVTAVSSKSAGLASQLGITTLLHPAHLADENGAPTVLAWLKERRALLDGVEDREVIRRLAMAGRAGSAIETPLADGQLCALRDAFERLSQEDQDKLGPDVGRAVQLESYTYDSDGQKLIGSACPVAAYLPRRIETGPETFANAAAKTAGPVWLSERYTSVLRSETGREGIGARKLLRLLGAEIAPRLRPHPQLEHRFSTDGRRGLRILLSGGPGARIIAMRHVDATYTLEDYDSPDLLAVISDISLERQGGRRRERARAMLSALGRAWDRRLSDYASVYAASDYYVWDLKREIAAFWLAQASDIPWLDDESGVARKPIELRVRTPSTEALHGANSANFLHEDLDPSSRRPLLTALGISGDPSQSELVERLRELREFSEAGDASIEAAQNESAVVYRALTRSLTAATPDSDLTRGQLRRAFARGDLILSSQGWRRPDQVLAGLPIFGARRAFVPLPEACERLWRALNVPLPSARDCLDIIEEITHRRRLGTDQADEAILLETLGALAKLNVQDGSVDRKKLAKLRLWTSEGWTRDRPVYAIDDSVLAAELGCRLPIWKPGGGLEQFRSLLESLRVTEINASEARVIQPERAIPNQQLTEFFRSAVELLRDDLQRNDRALAATLTVSWDSLTACEVKIHPRLSVVVKVPSDDGHDCRVNAKFDLAEASMFVTEPATLFHVDGGGAALAALFEGDARLVMQAWRVACDRAEEGIQARSLELASDRARRETTPLDVDLSLTQSQASAAQRHRSSPDSAGAGSGGSQSFSAVGEEQSGTSRGATPRRLVDAQSLVLVDPRGATERGSSGRQNITAASTRHSHAGLVEPRAESRAPQSRLPYRAYSDLEKENVGFDLFVRALGLSRDEITDLRTQRGVGADAVDRQGNYYELKVFGGPEPNEVTLTNAELQRALSTSDFYLVTVSNVEEGSDEPTTVRFLANPVQQLRPTDRGTVTLTGVREVGTRTQQFARPDETPPDGG